jgi:putative PIN family toxin of toxin-antitoxin system
VLHAWQRRRFEVVISEPLLSELAAVCQRPRLRRGIPTTDLTELLDQLRFRGDLVDAVTVPPGCRDPKDDPVLATAIDGQADAIVSGDSDLRADPQLRESMMQYGIALWGIDRLLEAIDDAD